MLGIHDTVSVCDRAERQAVNRAADLAPVIVELRWAGATSLRDLTERLNARSIPAARGDMWIAV